MLAFAAVIVAIVGVTIYLVLGDLNSQFATRHDSKPAADGVQITTYLSFDQERIFPFSLVQRADGTRLVSQFGTGTIMQVDGAGGVSLLAKPAAGVGALAVSADGTLYAITYTTTDRNTLGTVARINADGSATALEALPNGPGTLPLLAQLSFDPDGNLYVTDPSHGQVWRYRAPAMTPELWWTTPQVSSRQPQPVAITYDPGRARMLVSDVSIGTLYSVPLTGGTAEVVYRQSGMDIFAVTVDSRQRVFVATWKNDSGSLHLLRDDGNLLKLADDLRGPSAIVVQGDTAYVVNSDIFGVLEAGAGLLRPRAVPPFTVDRIDFAAALQ
jgi:sugar lactone lactonase YvrE